MAGHGNAFNKIHCDKNTYIGNGFITIVKFD